MLVIHILVTNYKEMGKMKKYFKPSIDMFLFDGSVSLVLSTSGNEPNETDPIVGYFPK